MNDEGDQRETGTEQAVDGLFIDQKAKIPKEWHDAFDTLVGQGKSPTGIIATIEYIRTPKSQQEVAEEFDVAVATIKRSQTTAVEAGPLESKQEAAYNSKMTAMDLFTEIADTLGWDEGTEYALSTSGNDSSPQPELRKAGWVSLHEAVASETDGGESSSQSNTEASETSQEATDG